MTHISHKNNANKLSEQVKNILQEKGFSAVFNYNDFLYFKKQVKNAFNKANAIAELFIEENININSDFNDYIY